MEQGVTKEGGTILKLLSHTLSKRGAKCEDNVLWRLLLLWCQYHGFPADPASAFEIDTWDWIGKALWDLISQGDKATKGLVTAWQLVFDKSQTLKAEKPVGQGPSTDVNPDRNKVENKPEAFPVQIKVFNSDPTQYMLPEDDDEGQSPSPSAPPTPMEVDPAPALPANIDLYLANT